MNAMSPPSTDVIGARIPAAGEVPVVADHDRIILTVARVTATVLVALVALRLAWFVDDALITLRSALNITHGWGPGFNATESVQAYTHPLWYLLWLFIGVTSDQWIVGILLASVALTSIAAGLLFWQVMSVLRLVVVALILLTSNAFMEYSSSGLENSLSYAMIALVFVLTLKAAGDRLDAPTLGASAGAPRPAELSWAILLGLSLAGLLLTRFDLAIIVAVPVCLLAWSLRRQWRLLAACAGGLLLPLLIWFSWAYLTYRSFLPNTFLAKRNLEIPQYELTVQGLRYLWLSFDMDRVTLVALVVGLAVSLALGPWLVRAWAIGVIAYLGYVVWIGGDWMAGRFLAVPTFVAMFALGVAGRRRSSPAVGGSSTGTQPSRLVALAALVLLVLAAGFAGGRAPSSVLVPSAERWDVDQNFNFGINDALGAAAAAPLTLKSVVDQLSLAYSRPPLQPLGDGSGLFLQLREVDRTAKEWPTNDGGFTLPSEVGVFCGGLGYLGIATGPTVHLIDDCALTDRYLASRPSGTREPFAWKPGHFHRPIPQGYVDAVRTGDPSQVVDAKDRFELTELWAQIRR